MTILPAGNCEDLGVAANSAAKALVRNYQKRDENYDPAEPATAAARP